MEILTSRYNIPTSFWIAKAYQSQTIHWSPRNFELYNKGCKIKETQANITIFKFWGQIVLIFHKSIKIVMFYL